MYLHLEYKVVPGDRRTEAVERLTRLHRLMAAAPGYIDAQISAGLDDPNRYLITRSWQDAAAHAAYRASPAQQEYARNRPASLPWENLAVQEWEAALVSNGDGKGNGVLRLIYDVGAGGWSDFIAEQRERDAAATRAGGLAYARSYRLLGADALAGGEALVLVRSADAGSDPMPASESIASRLRLRERFEVVVETLPA